MKRVYRLSIISWLCVLPLLLASCSGWYLRGSENAGLSFNSSVFLSGEPSDTYRIIEKNLTRINLLATALSGDFLLDLEKENIQRRSASRNSDATTAEFELTLTITYEIRDNEQNVLRPKNMVRITRSYNFNQNDIGSSNKEETLLRKDLQRAAARQIIQQLTLLDRIRNKSN
jgi:LPS-assembly lipoprotein